MASRVGPTPTYSTTKAIKTHDKACGYVDITRSAQLYVGGNIFAFLERVKN